MFFYQIKLLSLQLNKYNLNLINDILKSKISIRFFNDREVRAVGNDENKASNVCSIFTLISLEDFNR